MQFKLPILGLLLVGFVSGYNFTCYDSMSIKRFSSQCTLVTWNVARILDPKYEDNPYEPVVYPISKQEELVSVIIRIIYFTFRSYMQSIPVIKPYLVPVGTIC